MADADMAKNRDSTLNSAARSLEGSTSRLGGNECTVPAFGLAAKRVLGSASGTIVFQPGWDEPLSDPEMQEFVGD